MLLLICYAEKGVNGCNVKSLKFQIPSPKFQVPNSKFQIPNSKFQAQNPRKDGCTFPCSWNLEFGIWILLLNVEIYRFRVKWQMLIICRIPSEIRICIKKPRFVAGVIKNRIKKLFSDNSFFHAYKFIVVNFYHINTCGKI